MNPTFFLPSAPAPAHFCNLVLVQLGAGFGAAGILASSNLHQAAVQQHRRVIVARRVRAAGQNQAYGTVSVAVPLTLPSVAVIVTVPAATARPTP